MSRLLRMCLPVLIMFGLVSCLKEKSIDSTEGGGGATLRMKIDGKQWTANKTAAVTIMNGFVSIMGASQDNFDLLIQVKTGSAGTYQLDPSTEHFAILLDNNEATPVGYATNQGANSSIAGGTVNITKIDPATKRISGNFAFKLYRSSDDKSLMITEGFFENLTYTDDPPPTGTGNSLKAKVNGTEWIATQAAGTLQSPVISISGTDVATGRILTIMVPETIDAGDYTLDNSSVLYQGIFVNAGKGYGAGAGGTLKITEHQNNTIKGTFQFTAQDQDPTPGPNIAITEGSFSVTY